MASGSSSAALVELTRRIMAGESGAEEELVQRYSRAVARILRKSVRGSIRDDLYQEVFRTAIEKIRAGELRDPERLSGFVCSLTQNLALGYLRKSNPYEPFQEEPQVPGDQVERLLAQEREQAARKILAELESPRDREVLYRYYLAEEDKESICAGLGLSSAHLNQVLHRARLRFRELYERAAGPQAGPEKSGGA
jgi:RNA polymerase sigma-70 factor (ECF subfamily)